MATEQIQFGDYEFTDFFQVESVSGDSRMGTAEIPRRDGLAVGTSRLREKTIRISGMLTADSAAALQTLMDDLLAALNAGRQKLYLWSDRYMWATKTATSTDYHPGSFERFCNVSIDFLADTGLWESDTEKFPRKFLLRY